MSRILQYSKRIAAGFAAAGAGFVAAFADLPADQFAFPGGDADASANLPALPAPDEGGVDLDGLFEAFLGVIEARPDGTHTIEGVVENAAADHEAAFAFVRDELAFDPYEGALRGAHGAMGARAANDVDRAILLAALLDAMGLQTRFAMGPLEAEAAETLRTRALSPALPPRDDVLRVAGFSDEALARMSARARRDYAWLSERLGDRVTGTDEASLFDGPHVWVQARLAGRWTDFDASFADAEPGQRFAEIAEIVDEASELQGHDVEIRVIAETEANGELTESVLLEWRAPARDAAQANIFLTFAPRNSGLGSVLEAAVAGPPEQVPVLLVDEDETRGDAIPQGGVERNEAQDFFFGETAASDAELAALYLDVTAHSPGREPLTRRRVLRDRVPAAARASGNIARTDFRPLDGDDPNARPFQAVHQILVSTGGADPRWSAEGGASAIAFVAQRMGGEELPEDLSINEIVWPIGVLNEWIRLAAETVTAASVEADGHARLVVDAPRVSVLSYAVTNHDDAPQDLTWTMDLLLDGVGVVSDGSLDDRDIAMRRLWHGVVQSAFETTSAELRAAIAGANAISVSTQMNADIELLASVDEAAAGLPPASRNDLSSGELVVTVANAADTGEFAWWAVDPDTGLARARIETGLGGSKFTLEGGRRQAMRTRGSLPGSGGGGSFEMRGGRMVESRPTRPWQPGGSRRPPPQSRCGSGNEYTILMGCVSIPASMAVGEAYTWIVGEIVFFAALTIATM